MSVRYARHQAGPEKGSPMLPGHIGLGPGFIDEYEMRGGEIELHRLPLGTLLSDIRSLLFSSNQDFFLKVSLSAWSARHSVWTLRSVPKYSLSSRSVRSGFSSMAARIRSASAAHFGVRRLVREGATFPSSRRSCLIRRTQDSLTRKRRATARVPSPASQAAKTSTRNSGE